MRSAGVASISSSSASRSASGVPGGGLTKSGVQAPRRWSARRTVMSRSATRSRVAATQGRWSDLASGWSSVRTLLWSSISGEIANRRFATSSGPKRKRIIQLSLNLLAPRRRCPQPVAMIEDRHLPWDGCANVRDLGGLPAGGARTVRRGAIVRADALDRLGPEGWAALEAHGVRTVIDLRNDVGFWKDWHGRPEFGTPIYYGPFLAHFPGRTAAVLKAVAAAEPGGVAINCGIGRDRTGLICILLLALAGVPVEAIAADYALSEARVTAGRVGDFYERAGTAPEAVVAELLAGLDVEAYLRGAGVTAGELAAIRRRMLSGRVGPALSAAGR